MQLISHLLFYQIYLENDISTSLNECEVCGEPTSSNICKACELKKLISENCENHVCNK